MSTEKLGRTLTVGVILLTWAACGGPERSLHRAEEERTREAFEEFLVNFPESEFAESARGRLAELDYWDRVKEGPSPDYSAYLASFPEGLFSDVAVEELAFSEATGADVISAYDAFLQAHPNSAHRDSASARIDSLEPALARFEIARSVVDLDSLRSFITLVRETGYARLVQQQLESASLVQAASAVFEDRRYSTLPKNLDSLIIHIENRRETESRELARQAYEDVLVGQIDRAGPGARVVLSGIDVTSRPDFDGHRYSVRAVDAPREAVPSWDYESSSFSSSGSFATDASDAVIFTEYPVDRFPLQAQGMPLVMPAQGEATARLLRLSAYDRQVWRIYGDVSLPSGYQVSGDDKDPLVFYLMEGIGAVYVQGTGSVADGDGAILISVDTGDAR